MASLPDDPRASIRPESPPGDDTQAIGPRATMPTIAPAVPAGVGASSTGSDTATGATAPGRMPYRLLEVIGRGGEGLVWRAVQGALNRVVAVKTIREDKRGLGAPDSTVNRSITRRFHEEAFIAARLDHPNIVPVHDLGRLPDGSPLLAMKLVRGRPWSAVLREDFDTLSPDELLQKNLPILLDLMQGVAFAHSRGIVHRDLKPSQVMLGEFGEVVLLDWGIALLTADAHRLHEQEGGGPLDAALLPDQTTATSPAGTPALMAPEQTRPHARDISPLTDVYLLGGILYYLLTGTFPHDAPTAAQSIERAELGVVEHPTRRTPGRAMPPDLVALALRALHPDPAERVASVRDFMAAISDHLSGASARRESTELTDRAGARLRDLQAMGIAFAEAGRGDFSVDPRVTVASPEAVYPRLEELRRLLEPATARWSGNPALAGLRDRVAAASAVTALAAGDLGVAGYLAGQVSAPTARAELLERIESARRTRARRDGTRRLALAGVGGLLLVLCAGGIKYSMDQRTANRALAAERDEAEAARLRAIEERRRAVAAHDDAERERYFATINFAGALHREGQISRVRELLLADIPATLRHWEWGSLWHHTLLDAMTVSITSGDNSHLGANFSADGRTIYTGDRRGRLIAWDTATGGRLMESAPHQNGVWFITPSPDGTLLLVTSFDGTATLVQTADLAVRHRLEGHTEILRGGAFSPDGRLALTTSRDMTIRAWNVADGALLWQASSPANEPPYHVAFLPDGASFVAAQRWNVVIRSTEDGRVLADLPAHPENILAVALNPEGTRLVTACTDRNARVFDLASGEQLFMIENRTSWLHTVRWSPDGALIATGDNDGTVRLWNATDGTMHAEFVASPRVFHVNFSPDSTRVLTSSERLVQLWRLDRLPARDGILAVKPLTAPPLVAPLQTNVYAAPLETDRSWQDYDHQYRLPESGHRHVYQHEDINLAIDSFYIAISPDGTRALRIDHREGTAVLEDRTTGTTIRPWPHAPLYRAIWSPAGDRLFIITRAGDYQLHDAATLDPIATMGAPVRLEDMTHTRVHGGAEFSPDGSLLVTGRRDGRIDLWDGTTGALVRPLGQHEGGAISIALSPNLAYVATGGLDSTAQVRRLADGQLVSTMVGHLDTVHDLDFHLDGRRLLTTGRDDLLKLWDVATGREVMTVFSLPTDRMLLASGFSADGRTVYTASSDLTIYLAGAMDWTVQGAPGDIVRAMELEKRRRHLGDVVEPEDVDMDVEAFLDMVPNARGAGR